MYNIKFSSIQATICLKKRKFQYSVHRYLTLEYDTESQTFYNLLCCFSYRQIHSSRIIIRLPG